MFCAKCGNEFVEGDVFCRKCGSPAPREGEPSQPAEPVKEQPVEEQPAAQAPQAAPSPEDPTADAPGMPVAQEAAIAEAPVEETGGEAAMPAAEVPVAGGDTAQPNEASSEGPVEPPEAPGPAGETYTAPGVQPPSAGQTWAAVPSGGQTTGYPAGGQPPAPPAFGAPATQYGEAAPAYAVGQADAEAKKNKYKLPIIIVAAVLVVALLAALLVPRLLKADPTTYVMAAFGKTFATMGSEWAETGKTLGLEGYADAYETGSSHARFALEVSGIDATIDRAGISLEAWTDYEARRSEGTAALAMSGISLAELQFGLDDNIAWAEMPTLFSGVYGVDTETIGRDMDGYAGGYGFYDDIGFNLFDVYQTAREAAEAVDGESALMHADTAAKIAGLGTELYRNISTTKMDKTSVKINGHTQDVEEYFMEVSGDALEVYFYGVGVALASDRAFMEALEEYINNYVDSFYYVGTYRAEDIIDEVVEELSEAFKAGIRANVYIKGGCVVRADIKFTPDPRWERTEDTGLVRLEFGGAENLIDAVTLTIADLDYDDVYILAWSGQHKPVNGVFSTNFTSTNIYGSYEDVYLDASLEWDSAGDYNNLSFSVASPASYNEFTVTGRGSLAIDGKTGTFDMKLNNVTYQDYWDEEYTLALDYFTEPFDGYDFSDKNPTMLFSLSESGLEDLYNEISLNAMSLFLSLYMG